MSPGMRNGSLCCYGPKVSADRGLRHKGSVIRGQRPFYYRSVLFKNIFFTLLWLLLLLSNPVIGSFINFTTWHWLILKSREVVKRQIGLRRFLWGFLFSEGGESVSVFINIAGFRQYFNFIYFFASLHSESHTELAFPLCGLYFLVVPFWSTNNVLRTF